MTRDDLIDHLHDLIEGEIGDVSEIDGVSDGLDGNLIIHTGDQMFSLDIRVAEPDVTEFLPGKIRRTETDEERRIRLVQMIEEGNTSAERDGPVPPEEVHRMVEEAMAAGLRSRELRVEAEAKPRRIG